MDKELNYFVITFDSEPSDVIATEIERDHFSNIYNEIKEQIVNQHPGDDDFIDGTITDIIVDRLKEDGFYADYKVSDETYNW